MAIYHLSAQVINRGSGRTSVGAAAYRSGTVLTCERDGVTHDYSRRKDVVHCEITLPSHAPRRWLARDVLWNEVEAVEKARNAQLCREINVALPRELTRDEQVALARRYAESLAAEGMVVDWAVHDKDGTNPHVHLMLSLRPSTSEGFGAKSANAYLVRNDSGEEREATATELRKLGDGWHKVYKYKGGARLTQPEAQEAGLNPTKDRTCRSPVQTTVDLTGWSSKDKLVEWRARWADIANRALDLHGSPERIDHRSFKSRGVELLPTLHEGSTVTLIERSAEERARREGRAYVPVTDRRRENIRRVSINEQLRRLIRMITEAILARIEHAKTQASKRGAEQSVAKNTRRPRTKRPYAPQRGRRTSPRGGLGR